MEIKFWDILSEHIDKTLLDKLKSEYTVIPNSDIESLTEEIKRTKYKDYMVDVRDVKLEMLKEIFK